MRYDPVPLPSRDLLLAKLHYDPETGALSHRDGDPGSGRQISIDGRLYLKSRIIWKMLYNTEPPIVEHWDGDNRNNRKSNLREADHQQNAANSVQRPAVSGHRGVHLDRESYVAVIYINRQKIRLGTFKTPEEAAAVRRMAEKIAHGEYAFSNRPRVSVV